MFLWGEALVSARREGYEQGAGIPDIVGKLESRARGVRVLEVFE